jgi:2-dehydropantoate 2-reductase
MAGTAAYLAQAGAVILPLLNGVDAAEVLIHAGVPRKQVLGGVTAISASKHAPGLIVRHSAFQKITLGELPSHKSGTERTVEIKKVLEGAGIVTEVSESIEVDLWRKLVFIAALAAVCGLSRAGAGVVRKSAHGRDIFVRAAEETVAVAGAKGVELYSEDAESAVRMFDGLRDGIKPSLLLDVEKGGMTEVDALSGAVSRMGKELGVSTPVHDVAAALIGLA